ncbi:DEAD/DEAH box helicase [Microbispora hainanensis]|uniref:DEAD/DEAH box helicase n=1 Tax=Microbispora hainanensis TaxID=568844 RepID=A0A544YMT8_9ACTN|nr:DEAD/DEAH box helicase family protein [Microbispora hainanensis]TQS18064.1 DEAD/DEAH box helicase [Microbispora hainanensis]
MRYILKDYQFAATNEIVKALRRAGKDFEDDPNNLWSIALSAPTGAGKTVIATSVIETLFDGSGSFSADPLATVLWVTDDPALNEQTKRNMLQASSNLGPSRLITIDAGFDEEQFQPLRVYFLNIQKLARSNPLSRSNTNLRTYSLWETISNTIRDNGAHFYVVIDEAHRGMKQESDRTTIVSRIINGQPGINPPAPVVWGISATPERFIQAIGRWNHQRSTKSLVVPLEDVRASGLLKDKIILDNPAAGQVEGDTTLTRAAVIQTLHFEESWRNYAQAQGEPPVMPVLVVQVPNKPTDAEIGELLSAIFDSWRGLKDENVVNTFGEHTAISVAGHTINYMKPQDIQDDVSVRVVLCKDAISTGWDCPRAEVLVSLRSAADYTYIAQLIGRMVRTPLARRIPTDQTLNDVHCYLPKFNKQQVKDIVDRFAEGRNDEPPVEVITDPLVLERNENVPGELMDLVQSLPTYVVPGRIYRTQISRLHTLATLLTGDHVVEDAIAQVRIYLNGVLTAQRARLEAEGTFQADLARVRSLKIERSYSLLAAESMNDLPPIVSYEMDRDDNNIEDLYKVAKRKLPEGVATNYWNEVINSQTDDEYDPTEAKAITAVLALNPEVVEAVEAAAEQLVRTWLREYQRSISKLPDARKVAYEPVKRETRSPELTDLVLPGSMVVSDRGRRWEKHLLSAEDGTFPCALKGWEVKVLERELADADLVGWYRNPTGGNASLRIPYKGTEFDRAMYPDFILFHTTDDGIRPSIVDPHGFHLSDAATKLKGLAAYASDHFGQFHRIEAVAEVEGRLLALDLRSDAVREAIANVKDSGVKELFVRHGGDYS